MSLSAYIYISFKYLKLIKRDLSLVNPFWLFLVTFFFLCPEIASKRICSVIFPGKKYVVPRLSLAFLRMSTVFPFIRLFETSPDLHNSRNMQCHQSLGIFLRIPSGRPDTSISWDFWRDPCLNPLPLLVLSLFLELCGFKGPQDLTGEVQSLV